MGDNVFAAVLWVPETTYFSVEEIICYSFLLLHQKSYNYRVPFFSHVLWNRRDYLSGGFVYIVLLNSLQHEYAKTEPCSLRLSIIIVD